MGFGHRVYKNFDPRASVMKEAADEVLAELGIENDPLLEIAKRLEEIALSDEIFHTKETLPQRRLLLRHHSQGHRHPDQHVHGHFCRGRTVGWIAHWNEMIRAATASVGPGSCTRDTQARLDVRSTSAKYRLAI